MNVRGPTPHQHVAPAALPCTLPACRANPGIPGAKLGPRDVAYMAALKKISAAAATSQEPINATTELAAACASAEAAGAAPDGGAMSGVWEQLLGVLRIAAGRGLKPADGPVYVEALVQVVPPSAGGLANQAPFALQVHLPLGDSCQEAGR
jgi:hypothetical protein